MAAPVGAFGGPPGGLNVKKFDEEQKAQNFQQDFFDMAQRVQTTNMMTQQDADIIRQMNTIDPQQVNDFMPTLQNVTHLMVNDVQAEGLDTLLSLCTELEVLDLSNCMSVTDTALKKIGKLRHLRQLNLANCAQVQNIKPLANLRTLKTVILSNCMQIKDVEPISKLGLLENLDLSGCFQVKTIKPLIQIAPHLHRLNVTNVNAKPKHIHALSAGMPPGFELRHALFDPMKKA